MCKVIDVVVLDPELKVDFDLPNIHVHAKYLINLWNMIREVYKRKWKFVVVVRNFFKRWKAKDQYRKMSMHTRFDIFLDLILQIRTCQFPRSFFFFFS